MMKQNIVEKKEINNVIYLNERRIHKIKTNKKIAQNIAMLKYFSYGTMLVMLGGLASDFNINTNSYNLTGKSILLTLFIVIMYGILGALFLREGKRCLELM